MMAGLANSMFFIVALMNGPKLLLSGLVFPYVIFGYFFADIIIGIVNTIGRRWQDKLSMVVFLCGNNIFFVLEVIMILKVPKRMLTFDEKEILR